MISLIEKKGVIKEILREVVLEVMHKERLSFYDSIFPNASNLEIEEISKLYGKPENYKIEYFISLNEMVI